jgi:hypothetical protein
MTNVKQFVGWIIIGFNSNELFRNTNYDFQDLKLEKENRHSLKGLVGLVISHFQSLLSAEF